MFREGKAQRVLKQLAFTGEVDTELAFKESQRMKKDITAKERPFSQKKYIPIQILGLSYRVQVGQKRLHNMA